DNLEQRRLTGAIRADQPDALPLRELEAETGKDKFRAEALGEIVDGQNRSGHGTQRDAGSSVTQTAKDSTPGHSPQGINAIIPAFHQEVAYEVVNDLADDDRA